MTVAPDAAAIDVRCLGSFAVKVDGRPVNQWRAGKARTLFQFLLANRGQVITKERLEDVLWPESDVSGSSLRVAVHALRRVLGSASPAVEGGPALPRVEYRDVGYMLDAADVRTDVDEFEDAVHSGRRALAAEDADGARAAFLEAVRLYTGDYLAQDDAEWVYELREWARSLLLEALGALRRDAINRRDNPSAAEWSRRILHIDPYHEPSYRSLMAVHAKRGERGQAKVWFELCQRRLSELGVDVDIATRRLYQGLVGVTTVPAHPMMLPHTA